MSVAEKKTKHAIFLCFIYERKKIKHNTQILNIKLHQNNPISLEFLAKKASSKHTDQPLCTKKGQQYITLQLLRLLCNPPTSG